MRRFAPFIAVGLLCAGLFCVSQAPAQVMSLTGAGLGVAGGASCTFPAGVTGMVGRYNALPGNFTQVAGNVTVANDLSGSSNTVVNSGTVPYNASSAYHSKPAFDFQAGGALTAATMVFPLGSGSTFSVWSVLRFSSSSSAAYPGIGVYAATGQANDFDNIQSFAFTAVNTSAQIQGTVNGNSTGAGTISTNTNYSMAMISNGTNSSIFVNGSSVGSGGPAPGFLGSTGHTVIGGRWNSSAIVNFWYGPMTEILFSSADLTSQLSNLETYRACQWGT